MNTVPLVVIWNIRCKLWVEGNRLRAEADRLWEEAILEVYGDIKLKWTYRKDKDDYACELETGEVFKP